MFISFPSADNFPSNTNELVFIWSVSFHQLSSVSGVIVVPPIDIIVPSPKPFNPMTKFPPLLINVPLFSYKACPVTFPFAVIVGSTLNTKFPLSRFILSAPVIFVVSNKVIFPLVFIFSNPVILCKMFKFGVTLVIEVSPKFKISFPKPPFKSPFICTVLAIARVSFPSSKFTAPFIMEAPEILATLSPVLPLITATSFFNPPPLKIVLVAVNCDEFSKYTAVLYPFTILSFIEVPALTTNAPLFIPAPFIMLFS